MVSHKRFYNVQFSEKWQKLAGEGVLADSARTRATCINFGGLFSYLRHWLCHLAWQVQDPQLESVGQWPRRHLHRPPPPQSSHSRPRSHSQAHPTRSGQSRMGENLKMRLVEIIS